MNTSRKSMTNRSTMGTDSRTSESRMQAGNLLIGSLFGGLALADARDIFARNLKFWLDKRELTGAELARRLGKKQPVISQWLNRVSGPDLATIGVIADKLEIPMTELFRENGERPNEPLDAKPDPHESERILRFVADKLGFEVRLKPKRLS